MGQEVAAVYEATAVRQGCSHHWTIEIASGPVSRGVCKSCGATREFNNYLQDCVRQDRDDYLEWVNKQGYEEDAKLGQNVVSQAEQLLQMAVD